jgi:hypothetical protein
MVIDGNLAEMEKENYKLRQGMPGSIFHTRNVKATLDR